MNPLIKWPGGKSNEIDKVKAIIPKYSRYIEPFFGGGAMFFFLRPSVAAINDISSSLIEFYNLIKRQDKELYDLLLCYNNSFDNLLKESGKNYHDILSIYTDFEKGKTDKYGLTAAVSALTGNLASLIKEDFAQKLLLNRADFLEHLNRMIVDKMQRTVANNEKNAFNAADLKENLITGFASGYYMYFRKIFNDINLHRINVPGTAYRIANFYFIREYCYGSMFRYNAAGEFNIPYGGMSYNKKNFRNKIENIFNAEIEKLFSGTGIYCSDFEEFFQNANLSENDFMFLDPPYDTNFSDYEGLDFTKSDQERLAAALRRTPARFILVIKNTDFINGLYENDFNILAFDNQYTYNVRSRNQRSTEHLIITNIPVEAGISE